MKRRFIVAAQGLTNEEERQFIAYLRNHKVAWWHWIVGLWLIVDKTGKFNLEETQSHLRKTSATKVVVIEIGEEENWAGFGPSVKGKDMFQWFRDAWDE